MQAGTSRFKVVANYSSIRRLDDGWLEGWVATRFGFVVVSGEGDRAFLRFILDGIEYRKTIKRRTSLTDRSLAIAAGKFAKEIAQEVKVLSAH